MAPVGPGTVESAPVAPVGPVAPAPVGPVAPAPVGPVAPASPLDPVAPVGPVAPASPLDPVAPVGPVAPASPLDPVAPVGPVAPVAPVPLPPPPGPVGPTGPVGPVSPDPEVVDIIAVPPLHGLPQRFVTQDWLNEKLLAIMILYIYKISFISLFFINNNFKKNHLDQIQCRLFLYSPKHIPRLSFQRSLFFLQH